MDIYIYSFELFFEKFPPRSADELRTTCDKNRNIKIGSKEMNKKMKES